MDMEISQVLKERFTEKGLIDLKTLLNTYIRLFNENKFPFSEICLGFGTLNIEDREECFGRIRCLSDLLFIPIQLNKIESDGKLDFQVTTGE